MLRTILAAGLLAAALPAASTLAQQQPPAEPQQTQPPAQAQQAPAPPPSTPDTADAGNMIGLPVYSSDGQHLGEITEAGKFAGKPMLRAEMSSFLGIGPSSVLIPQDVFEHRVDRIEIALTADQVKATIARQREKR